MAYSHKNRIVNFVFSLSECHLRLLFWQLVPFQSSVVVESWSSAAGKGRWPAGPKPNTVGLHGGPNPPFTSHAGTCDFNHFTVFWVFFQKLVSLQVDQPLTLCFPKGQSFTKSKADSYIQLIKVLDDKNFCLRDSHTQLHKRNYQRSFKQMHWLTPSPDTDSDLIGLGEKLRC